jgi:hypothetical protein
MDEITDSDIITFEFRVTRVTASRRGYRGPRPSGYGHFICRCENTVAYFSLSELWRYNH